MANISITRIFHFEAAHHLPYHAGKCRNIHGHSYKVEVTVSNEYGVCMEEEEPCFGMVLDFKELDRLVNGILDDKFDHRNLNTSLTIYPTAENLAKYLAESIRAVLDLEGYDSTFVDEVRVWETDNSYATWKR